VNVHVKRIACLILLTTFLVSSTSVSSLELKKSPSQLNIGGEDIDPLVNIFVFVEIQKIRSLEKRDIQTCAIEKIDWFSDPDFYVKFFINGKKVVSDIWHNTKYISDPGLLVLSDVPDDEEFVDITIQLWDWNSGIDRRCDIGSDKKGCFDVELTYSIKTGHWCGDDELADSSGYGRLNGCDDGSIYGRDRDCELWFNIYQNDFDNDGIPYWTEVNDYGTDPMFDNTGEDADSDGIPIEWEWKWGYNPFEKNSHANLNLDIDGLDNIEEYLTSQWGSDPFRQDIFLEIDQMEIGPNGEGSTISQLTKDLLKIAFDRRNIVLHIDDGCMDGGQTNIPFDEETSYPELENIYFNFFLNGDSDYWRKGVFHYALILYHATGPGFVFSSDSFQVSTRAHDQIAVRYPIINRIVWADMNLEDIRAVVYAGAMMHETGHTLGIYHSNTPGCDDQEGKFPWQINFWKWRPYKSVMNYGYVYKMVDYSDGSRGRNDFDDWGRIDLKRFQK